jgi:hypothetical protein
MNIDGLWKQSIGNLYLLREGVVLKTTDDFGFRIVKGILVMLAIKEPFSMYSPALLPVIPKYRCSLGIRELSQISRYAFQKVKEFPKEKLLEFRGVFYGSDYW